jgi:hypothetical protein
MTPADEESGLEIVSKLQVVEKWHEDGGGSKQSPPTVRARRHR